MSPKTKKVTLQKILVLFLRVIRDFSAKTEFPKNAHQGLRHLIRVKRNAANAQLEWIV